MKSNNPTIKTKERKFLFDIANCLLQSKPKLTENEINQPNRLPLAGMFRLLNFAAVGVLTS